jgi:NAD+ synthase (glutamine-hydrolysing)
MLAYYQPIYERVEVNMSVSREGDGIDLRLGPTRPKEVVYYLPEEEIAYGPACYL